MSREEDVADERPVGRGRNRPQRGEPRSDGGRRLAWRERDCPNSGGRSSGTTAGPPLGEAARQAGDSAPALAAAAAPAGRGGFRNSRPFGSYGSRKLGGTDGRTGTVRRRPERPDASGATADGAGPEAAAAVDGHARGEGDGAPTGLAGGVAGDGSISAEGDVVLRGPLCARGPSRGRQRRRGRRSPT